MGLAHGTFCVGCCWMLMALLFVAGVMNLVWVAAITVFAGTYPAMRAANLSVDRDQDKASPAEAAKALEVKLGL